MNDSSQRHFLLNAQAAQRGTLASMTHDEQHNPTSAEAKYVEFIHDLHLPRYRDIPAIDLYMDQLLTYIDAALRPLVATEEKLLTASMVNNYVKQRIVPAPVSKRYRCEHVAMLMVICLMKRAFSMSDIDSLLKVSAATHSLENAYDFFCEAVEESLRQLFCESVENSRLGALELVAETPNAVSFALSVKASGELLPERRLAIAAATSVANKIYVEKCFELEILAGAIKHSPRKASQHD